MILRIKAAYKRPNICMKCTNIRHVSRYEMSHFNTTGRFSLFVRTNSETAQRILPNLYLRDLRKFVNTLKFCTKSSNNNAHYTVYSIHKYLYAHKSECGIPSQPYSYMKKSLGESSLIASPPATQVTGNSPTEISLISENYDITSAIPKVNGQNLANAPELLH